MKLPLHLLYCGTPLIFWSFSSFDTLARVLKELIHFQPFAAQRFYLIALSFAFVELAPAVFGTYVLKKVFKMDCTKL